MNFIAVGKNRRRALPINPARIPDNPLVVFGRINARDFVNYNRPLAQRQKAVRKTFRYIHHVCLFGGKIYGVVIAESRRIFSQVDNDIFYISAYAVGKFGVIGGRYLEMQTAHDIFSAKAAA